MVFLGNTSGKLKIFEWKYFVEYGNGTDLYNMWYMSMDNTKEKQESLKEFLSHVDTNGSYMYWIREK